MYEVSIRWRTNRFFASISHIWCVLLLFVGVSTTLQRWFCLVFNEPQYFAVPHSDKWHCQIVLSPNLSWSLRIVENYQISKVKVIWILYAWLAQVIFNVNQFSMACLNISQRWLLRELFGWLVWRLWWARRTVCSTKLKWKIGCSCTTVRRWWNGVPWGMPNGIVARILAMTRKKWRGWVLYLYFCGSQRLRSFFFLRRKRSLSWFLLILCSYIWILNVNTFVFEHIFHVFFLFSVSMHSIVLSFVR